ncbi:hypothetical protein ABNG33_24540 [Bacillus thuringiensis]
MKTITWKKAAQIQISIMQMARCTTSRSNDCFRFEILKVNLNTQNNPPYIFETGDKIIIDKEKSCNH